MRQRHLTRKSVMTDQRDDRSDPGRHAPLFTPNTRLGGGRV